MWGKDVAYFMAIERKEKLQTIFVEDFDRRIKQRYGQQLPIGTVPHRKYVVCHLQRPGMHKRDLSTIRPLRILLSHELMRLIGYLRGGQT